MSYNKCQQIVIDELGQSLGKINPEHVDKLIDAICSAEKVFFVGVGRVFLSLQSIAKRLNHLGISTHLVGEITEPHFNDTDILIVGSGSGNTVLPLAIAKKAKQFKGKVIHIGANPDGALKEFTDLFVRIPVRTKQNLTDEVVSEQPMTSLFEQSLLLLGDVLAMMIIEKKNLDISTLWEYHANLE